MKFPEITPPHFWSKGTQAIVSLILLPLTAWSFTAILDIKSSIGLMVMVLIHELGHFVAFKIKRQLVSLPIFIPFLGAFVSSDEVCDLEKKSFVYYAGPLAGSLAAVLTLAIALLFGIWPEMLLKIGFFGLLLNLVNLVPLKPFDGGGITEIFGKWPRYFGIAALLILTWFFKHEPTMLSAWALVLFGFDAGREIRKSVRFVLGTIVLGAMIAFTVSGLSLVPWVFNLASIILVFVLNAMGLGEEVEESKEWIPPRLLPEKKAKRKWAVLYIGLVLFLFTCIILQIKFMHF